MFKLFHSPGSCSVIPHIVLEEVGAPYEDQVINFRTGDNYTPEYLAINPKARVPSLGTDKGVLTEIPAIIAYLARLYPEADLAPLDDPFAFAEMQAFHLFIATSIHVTNRQIFRPEAFADGEEAKAALAAKVPVKSKEYFTVIEDMLSDGRTWVHGEKYSLSDIYLFVFSTYLKMPVYGDLTLFPLITAHRARARERPAIQRVLAAEGLTGIW